MPPRLKLTSTVVEPLDLEGLVDSFLLKADEKELSGGYEQFKEKWKTSPVRFITLLQVDREDARHFFDEIVAILLDRVFDASENRSWKRISWSVFALHVVYRTQSEHCAWQLRLYEEHWHILLRILDEMSDHDEANEARVVLRLLVTDDAFLLCSVPELHPLDRLPVFWSNSKHQKSHEVSEDFHTFFLPRLSLRERLRLPWIFDHVKEYESRLDLFHGGPVLDRSVLSRQLTRLGVIAREVGLPYKVLLHQQAELLGCRPDQPDEAAGASPAPSTSDADYNEECEDEELDDFADELLNALAGDDDGDDPSNGRLPSARPEEKEEAIQRAMKLLDESSGDEISQEVPRKLQSELHYSGPSEDPGHAVCNEDSARWKRRRVLLAHGEPHSRCSNAADDRGVSIFEESTTKTAARGRAIMRIRKKRTPEVSMRRESFPLCEAELSARELDPATQAKAYASQSRKSLPDVPSHITLIRARTLLVESIGEEDKLETDSHNSEMRISSDQESRSIKVPNRTDRHRLQGVISTAEIRLDDSLESSGLQQMTKISVPNRPSVSNATNDPPLSEHELSFESFKEKVVEVPETSRSHRSTNLVHREAKKLSEDPIERARALMDEESDAEI